MTAQSSEKAGIDMEKQVLYQNHIGRVCAPGTVDYIDRPVFAPEGDEVIVAP